MSGSQKSRLLLPVTEDTAPSGDALQQSPEFGRILAQSSELAQEPALALPNVGPEVEIEADEPPQKKARVMKGESTDSLDASAMPIHDWYVVFSVCRNIAQ